MARKKKNVEEWLIGGEWTTEEEFIDQQKPDQKPVTKKKYDTTWVLRVYDSTNPNALEGEQYFLILKEGLDYTNAPSNDCSTPDAAEASYELERSCDVISMMRWQSYDSYIIGTISDDVAKSVERYWSEVTNYHNQEIVIDSALVDVYGKYRLLGH